MRFIPFVVAGATLTFFITYAYAKPVINSEALWCGGYTNEGCSAFCGGQNLKYYTCGEGYVQMPSYKFDLTLTFKIVVSVIVVKARATDYPVS